MSLDPEPTGGGSTADDALTTRSAVWTRHWASGAPHSCVGTYGERYGGAVADFWRDVFAPLRDAQRVLDVATGNGALPRLLLGLQPDAQVCVDAIDLAAIAPRWLVALPQAQRSRVRFHARQLAEALPFPDGSFDLVVSQYGIEYSDLDRSIPELLRVLAPGGRVALLMHATDSRPVTLAAVELAHIDWLLSDAGLLAAVAAVLEPIASACTAQGRAALARDPRAEAARELFNAAQDALRGRAGVKDGADVLFEVQGAVAAVVALAANRSVAAARSHLNEVEIALRDSRLRLQQMCDHALTRSQFDALGQSLHRAAGGCAGITFGEVRESGYLMGRTFVAQPAVASNS